MTITIKINFTYVAIFLMLLVIIDAERKVYKLRDFTHGIHDQINEIRGKEQKLEHTLAKQEQKPIATFTYNGELDEPMVNQ